MTTTADPLSAGLIVRCLFKVSCLRASLSGFERLFMFGFRVFRFERSASLSRIKPSRVGGPEGFHDDLFLNLKCLKADFMLETGGAMFWPVVVVWG